MNTLLRIEEMRERNDFINIKENCASAIAIAFYLTDQVVEEIKGYVSLQVTYSVQQSLMICNYIF
jgi:hypothetical protein